MRAQRGGREHDSEEPQVAGEKTCSRGVFGWGASRDPTGDHDSSHDERLPAVRDSDGIDHADNMRLRHFRLQEVQRVYSRAFAAGRSQTSCAETCRGLCGDLPPLVRRLAATFHRAPGGHCHPKPHRIGPYRADRSCSDPAAGGPELVGCGRGAGGCRRRCVGRARPCHRACPFRGLHGIDWATGEAVGDSGPRWTRNGDRAWSLW